jgi:hypothetical protein
MSLVNLGIIFALLLQTRGATVTERAAPTIKLDAGTFTGTASSSNTQSFLGIPFAKPPCVLHKFCSAIFLTLPRVGDLRFRLPVAVDAYTGSHTVNSFGPACPQQAVVLPILSGFPEEVIDYIANSAYGVIFPSAEDCG